MKMIKNFKLATAGILMISAAGLLTPSTASAAIATANGTMTMNLDSATMLTTFGFIPTTYFDQAQNDYYINKLTPGYATNGLGMQFQVNGNPAPTSAGIMYGTSDTRTRPIQATTFTYDTAGPVEATATGQIGFDGSIRITKPDTINWLKFDNLSMKYTGGKWVVYTNENRLATGDPDGFGTQSLFELSNVVSTTENGALKFSADLSLGNSNWANGFGLDGTLKLGTMSITPSAVPVPAAVWLFGSALLGLTGYKRRKLNTIAA
ncbi:MAG: hypothetical protein HOP02_15300 [Methylococcaceae bacterium]|nr:hypothetical protein [Methylococcaceae bacterium]